MGGLILFICKESRRGIIGGTRIAGLYIGVQLVYIPDSSHRIHNLKRSAEVVCLIHLPTIGPSFGVQVTRVADVRMRTRCCTQSPMEN